MRNTWNESVIQVLPAGFGTKGRKLPPKRRKLPLNGVNRNKEISSHSSELCQGSIYVNDNHCMHNVVGAH